MVGEHHPSRQSHLMTTITVTKVRAASTPAHQPPGGEQQDQEGDRLGDSCGPQFGVGHPRVGVRASTRGATPVTLDMSRLANRYMGVLVNDVASFALQPQPATWSGLPNTVVHNRHLSETGGNCKQTSSFQSWPAAGAWDFSPHDLPIAVEGSGSPYGAELVDDLESPAMGGCSQSWGVGGFV